MNIAKMLLLTMLVLPLLACGSLTTKIGQLKVGDAKTEVRSVMGSPNYSKEEGNLAIWQYAVVAGFGYCDYRQIWFWNGQVTSISGYHNASIAGCSAGLRHVDWDAAMSSAPADKLSTTTEHPKAETSSFSDELIKLDKLHSSGVLTDAEFEQAKRKLLTK